MKSTPTSTPKTTVKNGAGKLQGECSIVTAAASAVVLIGIVMVNLWDFEHGVGDLGVRWSLSVTYSYEESNILYV